MGSGWGAKTLSTTVYKIFLRQPLSLGILKKIQGGNYDLLPFSPNKIYTCIQLIIKDYIPGYVDTPISPQNKMYQIIRGLIDAINFSDWK